MEIQEYLNQVISKEVVDKMLLIDNAVQHQKIDYDDIYEIIVNTNKLDKINDSISIISDGDLENTINILINYYDKINYIYTDKHNLGIFIYIVTLINGYLEENGYDNNIVLEKDKLNNDMLLDNIIISGEEEFVLDFSNRLHDKNIKEMII